MSATTDRPAAFWLAWQDEADGPEPWAAPERDTLPSPPPSQRGRAALGPAGVQADRPVCGAAAGVGSDGGGGGGGEGGDSATALRAGAAGWGPAMSDRTGNGSKTIRRYDVRGNVHGHTEWIGTFIITDDGYFSTVSGWGNYAFYWSHAGQCFRSFLARIDTDYLLHKISRANEYDGEATGKAVRDHILNGRRAMHISREDARREWDLFIDNERLETSMHFAWWYTDTKLGDASEYASHDFPSEAKHFAKLAWPHFVAALRAELKAEREAVSQ